MTLFVFPDEIVLSSVLPERTAKKALNASIIFMICNLILNLKLPDADYDA